MQNKTNIFIAVLVLVIALLGYLQYETSKDLKEQSRLVNNHGQLLYLMLATPEINEMMADQLKQFRAVEENASTTPKK